MATTLKNFIATVKTEGMARTNKFTIDFKLPLGMIGSDRSQFDSKLQHILLFCDTTQLPGINVATTPNRMFGEQREVPYEKMYDNLSMSFYVDNSLVVKSLFDVWMSTIQDKHTRTFSYYRDFITNIIITVYDSKNKPRYQVELFEAYPKTVSSISLDYNGKEVMKLNVNFVYKYYNKTEYASTEDKYTNVSKAVNAFNNDEGLKIPDGYFTDFAQFQNTYTNYADSFENARSSLYNESQNFVTGTGERVAGQYNKIKNKLGSFIG